MPLIILLTYIIYRQSKTWKRHINRKTEKFNKKIVTEWKFQTRRQPYIRNFVLKGQIYNELANGALPQPIFSCGKAFFVLKLRDHQRICDAFISQNLSYRIAPKICLKKHLQRRRRIRSNPKEIWSSAFFLNDAFAWRAQHHFV